LIGLHRELIRRCDPETSLAWHADRLCMLGSTIRRYNKELGVVSTPIFGYRLIAWSNIDDPDL